MIKQTFKEYLASREQLLEAIKQNPISIIEYKIKNYCTLPLQINENKQTIGLKPKQSIIIEWHYNDINNPIINSIKFKGVPNMESVSYNSTWSSSKIQKWLLRYSTEEVKYDHFI